MSTSDDFWARVVELEHAIVTCATCRELSGDDPGSPQPSWVGAKYEPGGVVFVLRNPGVAPRQWSSANRRDQRLAELKAAFAASESVRDYLKLTAEMQARMQGLGGTGSERWGQWAHPVSKCVEGCLTPDRFAWTNLAKHRTPGAERKDRATTRSEELHGLSHLRAELSVLEPTLIVTVGAPARIAVQELKGRWKEVRSVKQQGASAREAYEVRDRLRALRLCAKS